MIIDSTGAGGPGNTGLDRANVYDTIPAPGRGAAGVPMAYQGSTVAGTAVADAIFGAIDPSGHLSVTWPSDASAVGGDVNSGAASPLGDQPKFFDQLPGCRSPRASRRRSPCRFWR